VERIGLIAGNGAFPLIFAREARLRGLHVFAVGHRGETRPELTDEVDSLVWVRVGQLGKMIAAFKRAGIRRAVMAGGIDKVRSLGAIRPDWRGLRFLATARGKGDDSLLRRLAAEFESEGIEIVSSTLFLDRLLVPRGRIAGPTPTAEAMEDVRLGCRVLAALGGLDVGQSTVVEGGVVLAVEAVEGTDAAIRRARELGRGRAVVVKMAKPGQDMRFDVPAVGPQTIETMAACGARTLALEAGSTIMLDGERLVALADGCGVTVLGCSAKGEVSLEQ